MSNRYNRKKNLQKRIATRRIHRLFQLAEDTALRGQLDRSNRYVFLARKLAMRYLVSIPGEFKRRFCKNCYGYLLPSVTCRVRIHRGKIITYCTRCHTHMRMPMSHRIKSS